MGYIIRQVMLFPKFHPANFENITSALQGASGVDVTGGMFAKVHDMLALVQKHPALKVQIINGVASQRLYNTLLGNETIGTNIIAEAN